MGQPVTILIAEDQQSDFKSLHEIVRRVCLDLNLIEGLQAPNGFVIDRASNRNEVEQKLRDYEKQQTPLALLLDVEMPPYEDDNALKDIIVSLVAQKDTYRSTRPVIIYSVKDNLPQAVRNPANPLVTLIHKWRPKRGHVIFEDLWDALQTSIRRIMEERDTDEA